MSNIHDELKKQIEEREKRLKPVKGFNYLFTFVVDNQTNIEFDDSFFAVGYEDGSTGGIVTGNRIPARTEWHFNVTVTGCATMAVGSLWDGSERYILEEIPPCAPDECRVVVGWRIFYGSSKMLTNVLGVQNKAK